MSAASHGSSGREPPVSAGDMDETAKLVDSIYKNILHKFNPGARQLATAAKAYLKSLHGASAASKTYREALSRLSSHAGESSHRASTDIGDALGEMVETYAEIHAQELSLLKAFYVDLIAPLESNLERDWRVVQAEHKRFTSHWRNLRESYARAQVGVEKSQKKIRNSKSSSTLDKEIKHIQRCDEERIKCELFLDNNLKEALTQERRRYGFVLERQCCLAGHVHALANTGESAFAPRLEGWNRVARARESLTQDSESFAAAHLDSQFPSSSRDGAGRRHRSVDSSTHSPPEPPPQPQQQPRLFRTSSNLELFSTTVEINRESLDIAAEEESPALALTPPRPAADSDSADSTSAGSQGERVLVRAAYAYLSSGRHQLSFLEGDTIACIGDQQAGWQFGESLRTRRCGWFPAAYTQPLADSASSHGSDSSEGAAAGRSSTAPGGCEVPPLSSFRSPPPGALTLPSKRPVSMHAELTSLLAAREARVGRSAPPPPSPPPLLPPLQRARTTPVLNGPADASLHSSNDSGFGADHQSAVPADPLTADARRSRGLPQTSRGWLVFSRAENAALLRPYLSSSGTGTGKSVQFDSGASEDRSSRSSSLLDHFVTIDRKRRRRNRPLDSQSGVGRLGRKASLLRAFRSSADDGMTSADLWCTPGGQKESPVAAPATILEEGGGRTSPRSLSESDLLDLDSGDTFLLVQDYRALQASSSRSHSSPRSDILARFNAENEDPEREPRCHVSPPAARELSDEAGGTLFVAEAPTHPPVAAPAQKITGRAGEVPQVQNRPMAANVPPAEASTRVRQKTPPSFLSMNHVIGDVLDEKPISEQQPASLPIRCQQPVSLPIRSQQPTSLQISSQQPASLPISGQQPASLPTSAQSAARLQIEIKSCSARQRRPRDIAHARTFNGMSASGGGRRKQDDFSVFERGAEFEDMYYGTPGEIPRSAAALIPREPTSLTLPTSQHERAAASSLQRRASLAPQRTTTSTRHPTSTPHASNGSGKPALPTPNQSGPPASSTQKTATAAPPGRGAVDLSNYGWHLSRRLYLPEQDSRLAATPADGERHGPWYDLWAADPSCQPEGKSSI